MPSFGETSTRRLNTAHDILKILFRRVVARRDCSITEGFRDEAKQDYYFKIKTSKVKWPDSKHNSTPSMAVDCVPWPEKWDSKEAFFELRDIVLESISQYLNMPLAENHFESLWGDTVTFTGDLTNWEDFWNDQIDSEWKSKGGIELEKKLGYVN